MMAVDLKKLPVEFHNMTVINPQPSKPNGGEPRITKAICQAEAISMAFSEVLRVTWFKTPDLSKICQAWQWLGFKGKNVFQKKNGS